MNVWVLLDEKGCVTAAADSLDGLWPLWNVDGTADVPDAIDLIAEGLTIGSYAGGEPVKVGAPLPDRELVAQAAL